MWIHTTSTAVKSKVHPVYPERSRKALTGIELTALTANVQARRQAGRVTVQKAYIISFSLISNGFVISADLY
ncbi:MAG: hypothetical protein EA343_23925 [Nodularia sp. (in: Bacteria)]|nr:MAG: hypothetical protein EA343_23925 [Nodularia sp. (in: cyanobacteria)]